MPGGPNLYLNTHPSELQSADFIDSLRELRGDLPELQMTLEIHEAAVTETRLIRELRGVCASLESDWRTTTLAPANRACSNWPTSCRMC